MVRELGNGARVCLKQRAFNLAKEKAGIARAHASAHGYTFGFKNVKEIKRKVFQSVDQLCR